MVGFSTIVFREYIFRVVFLLDGDCRKKNPLQCDNFWHIPIFETIKKYYFI